MTMTKQRDRWADTTALGREIDQFVCKLYDLAPAERKLMEESNER